MYENLFNTKLKFLPEGITRIPQRLTGREGRMNKYSSQVRDNNLLVIVIIIF